MILALVLSLVPAAELQSATAQLKVGGAAPKLRASKWVQGEPVNGFEPGRVYLVEFWATWCGPCRASIPHLNELHTKFSKRGLVVIGQDVWEEDQSLVAPFVKQMGRDMTYRVALDTVAEGQSGEMAQTWMDAAGQEGIPTAFVVDQRARIAWIGHPMELKESFLEELLGGTFDMKKAAMEYEAQLTAEEQIRTWNTAYRKHRHKEEWDQAEAALTQIEKLLPADQRDQLRLRRVGLFLDRKDYQAAYRLAEQISDSRPDDTLAQNSLAWDLVTREDIEEPNLKLAEKIARRANQAAKGKDPEILDTLARVLFLKGQQQAAVELEDKAMTLAEGRRKDTFQKVLESYQQGQLPLSQRLRTLWYQFDQHRKKKQWAQAETVLAQIEKLSPESERPLIGRRRLGLWLDRKDYPNASKLAAQLTATHKDEPMVLNQIAWEIAIRNGVEKPGLDVAESIARNADEITKNGNAEILDTLARVLFLKDQRKAALDLQQKAVELAKGRRKEQFQQTLDSYNAGKVPEPY